LLHVRQVTYTSTQSAIWRNGVEALTPQSICRAFDLLGNETASLKALYGIAPDQPSSCKTGALDLLHDVRFTLATETLVSQWRSAGRPVFRYLVDEPNPWQPSARAHHTVDLALLFGGFDLGFNPGACRVASAMARSWIEFIAGLDPWGADEYFAFGPLGNSRVLAEGEFAGRRRKRHIDAVREIGADKVDEVWKALAVGNMSLEN
jgi:carboxylesterase type B